MNLWNNQGRTRRGLKGNRIPAEVVLGEEDSISPTGLIVAAIERNFGFTLSIPHSGTEVQRY